MQLEVHMRELQKHPGKGSSRVSRAPRPIARGEEVSEEETEARVEAMIFSI